jgi:ABC-type sulfate/molybdate transport systems ATPase subunit
VRSAVADRGVPGVLVAHELAQAQAFADRLAVLDHGRILACGRPDEVVRRPASRRVAELVGYQGFVPAGAGNAVAGVHPERVALGAEPGRGLVLTGQIVACHPAGARWDVQLRTADADGASFRVLLPDRPATGGGELVVTLLDPPCFGPDGGQQVRA